MAEEQAAGILEAECPGVAITLSHRLGRIGLLERENAALLNAALLALSRSVTAAFASAIAQGGLVAPLYLAQNDGTVVSVEAAADLPVFTFASGPTNSMRGAAFLSGISDAIVVDVGGTTTDIGVLVRGFPREANTAVEVGGVRTLFRMPDVRSLALGGGTFVQDNPLAIGPLSTGYELTRRGLVFGGAELTMTDIAVAVGVVDLGDPARAEPLDRSLVSCAAAAAASLIAASVDRMKTSADAIPLVAVGGAAFLVPDRIEGISTVYRIHHGAVANAVGAAIARVSGEVDRIFHGLPRDAAIAEARTVAEQRAVAAGADPATLEVVDVEDLPLAYIPGSALRVRVRVAGDLA